MQDSNKAVGLTEQLVEELDQDFPMNDEDGSAASKKKNEGETGEEEKHMEKVKLNQKNSKEGAEEEDNEANVDAENDEDQGLSRNKERMAI